MAGLGGWIDKFVRPGRARSIAGQRLIAKIVRPRTPYALPALFGADDDEGLGAIDYEAYLNGGGGLAGWGDDLWNVAKGAASGALSTGANMISAADRQKAIDQAAAAQAAGLGKSAGGMSMPVKVAIGAAVAIPLLLVLTRKRPGTPVAA